MEIIESNGIVAVEKQKFYILPISHKLRASIGIKHTSYEIDWNALQNGASPVTIGLIVSEI